VWWLIFAGVFERHPGLRLLITETPGNWFPSTAAELDAVWAFYDAKRDEPLNKALLEQVPRPPSEYMANNVYYGASFASPFEVERAVAHGNGTQLLWGSDYPHLEGTFVNPEDRDEPSVTRLALRHTFCGLSAEETGRMVGQNAIDVYGLDAGALQAVADEIGAPTLEELATPIDAVPEGASLTAFRSGAGGWG
jgi:predicted TIM-barrel fold metal-dependent hydrolase